MRKLIDVGEYDSSRIEIHSRCRPIQACQSCALAKSKAITHPARPIQQRSMVLSKRVPNPKFNDKDDQQQGFSSGCISTDLVGPYTEASHANKFVGSQTFLLMDSKYSHVYGYVRKSDAIRNLVKFLNDVKLMEITVVSYHSDNAKELTGKEVQKILSDHAIKRSATSAYSPQENSYAERHNRTEMEGILSMMIRARYIPTKFWFECKRAFNHIYNRVPTTTSKGYMTPYQHVFGKIPNVEHLRIWGCKGFVNIPLEKRGKNFLPRAHVGYLVGYSEYQMNAYRMWLPHWDVVVTSRNVTFDEEIPRGDIDFSTDEYWLEIRKARVFTDARTRENIDDFLYLEGVVFYDDDDSCYYRVTRVTEHTGRYIVAHVMRYNPSITEDEQDLTESGRPFHVLDVERMLAGYASEDDIAAEMVDLVDLVRFPEGFHENQQRMFGSVEGDDSAESVARVTQDPMVLHDGQKKESGILESRSPFISGLAPQDRSRKRGCDTEYFEEKVEKPKDQTSVLMTETNCHRLDNAESCSKQNNDAFSETYDLPLIATEPVDYATAMKLSAEDAGEPRSYSEAITCPDRIRWLEAIAIEIENLKKREVLIEVRRPDYPIHVVDCKYLFKKKEKHGIVYKYKVRLVARGFSQIETINYNEVFSSVARHNSLRIFLKISIDRGHRRRSIDFEAAFLSSPLETEEIYLATPEGWSVTQGNVLRLNRSLYGLKQSSRYFQIMLTEFLISIGFSRCNSEPCMFVRDEGREMILIYVDDSIISCENAERIKEIIIEIKKSFELGEEGDLDWYIGSAIEDKENSLFMNQRDYIAKMLSLYNYDVTKTVETPLREKFAILRDPEDELFHDFKIREKVGSLMFTAVTVRPDIAFAVSYVARFTTHPSAEVCRAINHIFGYLAGTMDLGISFIKEDNSELVVYCDADYGSDINDYRSTSGVMVFIGSTIVGWYSSKQTTVAQSSTDAEILAMNFAAKEIIWIRGLLAEMGLPQLLPTKLKGDSQSAILLSRNPVFHKRTKHVMIKFMYLIECLRISAIINEFVAGIKNWADMLTKSQKKAFFLLCRDALHMTRRER